MNNLKIFLSFCWIIIYFSFSIITFPTITAAENNTIKIGYIDYTGFIDKKPDGSYSGYGVDYLTQISRSTGWKYEFIYDSWDTQLKNLKEGSIDFLCHAQITPERQKNYLFSKNSIGYEHNIVYAALNSNYYYNDYQMFNGMNIAFLAGSSQNDQFLEWSKMHNFFYTSNLYPTEEAAFDALNNNYVDAVVMGSLSNQKGYKIIGKFDYEPFYFMTSKQNKELLIALDNAITNIKVSNPSFEFLLHKKYYENSHINKDPLFTRQEAEYIKTCGTITIGQLPNRYPLSHYDYESNKLEGINEDLLSLIAEISGLKFEYKPIALTEKPLSALKDNKFDMVAGILKTEELQKDPVFSISDTLFKSNIVLVTTNGNHFNPYKHYKIAVKTSFEAMQNYINSNYPNFDIIYYTTDEECLDAIVNGNADIMLQNVYVVNYLLQKPKYESLNIFPQNFIDENSCIATLSKNNPLLLSIINKTLAVIDDQQRRTIVLDNTIAKPYQFTLSDILYKYKAVLIVGILSLLILCLMFLVIFKMKIKNFQMMEEKNQQLMDTLIQADEASQAKSRFLARMSHEIRTPMNAIVGLTEIAKKHLTDPNRIEQYLSKIDSASHVLLNIINDVLDMSAIKNNKLKIAHEKFDMKKIINSITAIYYNQCKQKGIKLEVILACLTHEILIGDSLRVNQIILNLISNASKFTPAGGKIRFEITEKAYKKQTIFIRIIVSDTGIGMTPEMLTRLFNTFEQENANTAQQYGGSGLGLSIVKNLVELMHGSISVESKKGIGSMFTVDLPFSIPKIDELSSSKSINDLRVLVVDNDCASRIYMTSILDRINVQYDIATTTEQTVKMLSTADKAGKHYDICFIDCKASFADSITLTKNIRKIYDKKALVIILSAYDISEIGENMETSGADIFLQKPLFQSTVFNMLISLTDKNYIKGTFHKESYDFHGKKVLLAEDNALNTEIAIELLNSVNLNVDHAENGQIAVDKFLTAPIGTYDIILMDIQMPVMNGYQATKTIRSSSHPNAKSIPIFAMTADAFTENVAEALSAGMNGHIAKPIDTHILYRTLCNCLRQA